MEGFNKLYSGKKVATKLTIEPKVEELWGKVCTQIHTALKLTKRFAFEDIGHLPTPSVKELLERLRVFDDVVGLLLDHAEVFSLDYTHTRLLLNCKQQVNMMERIVSAINANNLSDYEAAVEALEKQAHI
jgi:hypothetical protein